MALWPRGVVSLGTFGVEFCELTGEQRYLLRLIAIDELATDLTDLKSVKSAA